MLKLAEWKRKSCLNVQRSCIQKIFIKNTENNGNKHKINNVIKTDKSKHVENNIYENRGNSKEMWKSLECVSIKY